jgi:hypothetical protein
LELALPDHRLGGGCVGTTETGAWVRERRDYAPLLSQEQKPFALAIKSANRKHAACALCTER